MRYLTVLLLGLSLGIGGEFILPKSLYTTVGAGCIKQKSNGYIYIPQLIIYSTKIDPYPRFYGGHPMTFVPSYRYAYALLSGELSYLNQKDCNNIVSKFIDGRRKDNK